jgi:hypothetical protein
VGDGEMNVPLNLKGSTSGRHTALASSWKLDLMPYECKIDAKYDYIQYSVTFGGDLDYLHLQGLAVISQGLWLLIFVDICALKFMT